MTNTRDNNEGMAVNISMTRGHKTICRILAIGPGVDNVSVITYHNKFTKG